jgi:hypothetical protein
VAIPGAIDRPRSRARTTIDKVGLEMVRLTEPRDTELRRSVENELTLLSQGGVVYSQVDLCRPPDDISNPTSASPASKLGSKPKLSLVIHDGNRSTKSPVWRGFLIDLGKSIHQAGQYHCPLQGAIVTEMEKTR